MRMLRALGGAGGRRVVWYALGAALVAFALYTSAFRGEFVVMDDFAYVRDNPNLSASTGGWAFSSFDMATWHPLTWMSLWLDYAIWKLDPAGYHVTNALLHAACTFLVMLLFVRLISAASPLVELDGIPLKGLAPPLVAEAALVAAMVFAVHPAHAEAVAWISGRKVLLYSAFWLSSLIMYLRYVRIGGLWAYGASLGLFVLALLSQPMAATLPLAMLVMDWYPLKRRDRQSAVIEKLPFALLSLASAAVTYVAYKDTLGGMTPLPAGFKVLNAVRALGHYAAKSVAPVGLSPFYPQPMGGAAINAGHVGALVGVTLITLTAILLYRKAPVVLAGWAFFVALLLPVLGVIPMGLQAAADRYMYLALIGPLAMLSAGVIVLLRRHARNVRVAAWAVIVILSVLCVMQARVWRTSYTLWEHVMALYPNDAQPYAGLGLASLAAGRTEEALGMLDQAINIEIKTVAKSPRLHWLYSTRADALMSKSEYDKAVIDYSAAIRIRDGYDIYFIKRARAYGAMGEWDRAISDLRRATALTPGNVEALGTLGGAYLKRADYTRASEAFTKALMLKPREGSYYVGRAEAYMHMGQQEAAAGDMRSAARLGSPEAQNALRQGGMSW